MYLSSKIWNIVDESMLKEFKKRQMCSCEITYTVVPGQVKLVLGDVFASLANKQEVYCSQNGTTEMIWHVYSNTYPAILLFFVSCMWLVRTLTNTHFYSIHTAGGRNNESITISILAFLLSFLINSDNQRNRLYRGDFSSCSFPRSQDNKPDQSLA